MKNQQQRQKRRDQQHYDRFYTRERIMRLDELSFETRLERHTTKGSSSGRIMHLVPVFILETHNPDELQNVCVSSS